MVGCSRTSGQLGSKGLPVFTPVENLFLTGHWTQPGGGITPVIVSAQRVAKIILSGRDEGRDLAEQYFRFNSQALAEQGMPRAAAMEAGGLCCLSMPSGLRRDSISPCSSLPR